MPDYYSPITTTVQSITTAVALVTPQTNLGYQPLNPTGKNPSALLFHYEGENVVHLQSDITDHFIEDNTAIQDQMALKPEKITVHGFIGELNDILPTPFPYSGQIAAILPALAPFVPQFTTAGQDVINQAAAAYQTKQAAQSAATNAWGMLSGSTPQTVVGSSGLSVNDTPVSGVNNLQPQSLQQAVFQQFYQYWRTRTLFTVQTPWAVFTKMAIEELQALQEENTRMITDFHVTFKMMRFSTTFLETPDEFNGVGRSKKSSVYQGPATPAADLTSEEAIDRISMVSTTLAPP